MNGLPDPSPEAWPDRFQILLERAQAGVAVREREIARLSALYAALSRINHAMVRIPTPEALFGAVCRALVEQGGFSVAWIGWHDPATQRLMPVATCGDDEGDLQRVAIYADDRPEGRGPSGLAFRSGHAHISNDLLGDPAMAVWRPVLERRGLRSGATLPIRTGGVVRGVLSVYDGRADAFHDREVALLEEAAVDLAFGLESLARDEARRLAEAAEHSERLFSDTMIDSLPGIVYFYDERGRFLRWNRQFAAVSGYSAEEIALMHPLDFFAGDDRRRVQAADRRRLRDRATPPSRQGSWRRTARATPVLLHRPAASW